MMLKKTTGIALLGLACVAGIANAGTPHGCPKGISAAAPTELTLRSERTQLKFLRDSARVVYPSRAVLSNPGPRRQVELRVDFTDAEGYYNDTDGSLAHGKPYGAPTFAVKVDDRPVPARCDTTGNMFRFHWTVAAPKRGSLTVQVEAVFPWTPDDCAAPDHRIEWGAANDDVFDVSGASREMFFRFVPPVSSMAVESWTDGAEFERGAVTWRWRGHDPGQDLPRKREKSVPLGHFFAVAAPRPGSAGHDFVRRTPGTCAARSQRLSSPPSIPWSGGICAMRWGSCGHSTPPEPPPPSWPASTESHPTARGPCAGSKPSR